MYNAVGIDVSKDKSTVAILQPGGTVVRKPFNVAHSFGELKKLTDYILTLDGETKAVMECTGRYHEPILRALSDAGIFVSAVNPHLIKNFGNNTIRKVKSDPADSKKIARYTLDNWADLRKYSSMETIRAQLKTLNAQMAFFTKQKVAAKTNLISLLDMTYPGVNDLFDTPTRDDGSEKWVDYAASFWHVDCVRQIGLKAFTERYQTFCRRHGYNFQKSKPEELFNAARELVAPLMQAFQQHLAADVEQQQEGDPRDHPLKGREELHNRVHADPADHRHHILKKGEYRSISLKAGEYEIFDKVCFNFFLSSSLLTNSDIALQFVIRDE